MRPNYIPREVYLGDAVNTNFTFDFKIVNKNHLLVLLVDDDTGVVFWQTRGDDTTYFSTTLNADGTGFINTVAAPAIGTRIILLLADDSPTQPARFTIDDRYDLKKIESALDTLSGQLQRVRYLVDRSFKLPESFTANFPAALGQVNTDSVLVVEQDLDTLLWSISSVPRSAFIGPQGPIGLSPVIDVNPVTTDVDYAGTSAVAIDNTNPLAPILSFTLRAGPAGPQGDSTVLITNSDQLPDNGVGANGDMWFVFNIAIPEHGNVYQKVAGVYVLQGNIKGPPGGVESVDGEQGALEYSWVGYSGRFNQAVNLPTLRDAISFVIDLAYLEPLINTFVGTGSGTTRERGDTVTNPTLTVNVDKRTDDIAEIRYYDHSVGTLLGTQNSGAAIPNGGTQSFNTTISFTDNKSFRVEVDDVHSPVGTDTMTVAYTFLLAWYGGEGAPGLNGAGIAALDHKTIAVPNANQRVDFELDIGEVPYFAYPATIAALAQITDENGFDATTSFTARTATVTNMYGQSGSYRIYERNTPAGVANSTFYTFRR